MGGHALTPPTDRCLGKPLPYQLTNQTHTDLVPPELYPSKHSIRWNHGVLQAVSSPYPPVQGTLCTRYAPVRRFLPTEVGFSLDLHVLGLPLAFILS